MTNTEDLITMLYWLLGMILVIFVIDWLLLKPFQEHRKTDQIIERLRQRNNIFYQTLPTFKGRGIVVVINDTTMISGSLLLVTLRRLLCKLPILVCYAGDDLSESNRKFIESIQGTTTLAIGAKLDIPLESIRGSQLRAYSLIYSPFQEVLLLDASVLFFKNPDYLFSDPHYQQCGAVFWKDCKLRSSYWDKKVYDWIRRLIPYRKGDNRILDKKAGNYQSGKIMIFNKALHKKALEKLATLTREWEIVYNYIHSDKESYWIATELAKEEYYFVPSYPGIIGEIHIDMLCGHLLYSDQSGQLLALDDSLFYNGDNRYITDFTHYALFDGNAEWNNTIGSEKCLKNANVTEIPKELLALINEYAQFLHDLKNRILISAEYIDDSDSE
jgi:hypothetical protein